jgi:transposase InsO family protein
VSNLEIEEPEQIWVSNITYVGTRANPTYLALITDAYSKKILGLNVFNSLTVNGLLQVLEIALK